MTIVVTLEMLDNILKESYRCQASVLLAAVSAVFYIHLFAFISLVAVLLPVVERHHAALDLILYGVVRTTQMLGYAVDRPPVLQSNFNFGRSEKLRKR